MNQRHITEEKMDRAITAVINAYNQFCNSKIVGHRQERLSRRDEMGSV